MKSFILFFVLVFCFFEKSEAQDKWQIEIGTAIVMVPEKNIDFIGDQYLFQIPRLSVTKIINEKISVNGAISFNSIKKIVTAENDVNYFSIDSFLRYSLMKNARLINSYAFVGASLVIIQTKSLPAINFGFGNTFWVFKNLGISTQVILKLSDKNTSHFQFTGGLVYNLDSDKKALWHVKR